MIPRVGAALQRFISPVDPRQGSRQGESDSPDQRDPSNAKRLRLIQRDGLQAVREAPFPEGPPPENILALRQQALQPTPAAPSVALAFLELFALLKNRRAGLLRWLGTQRYQRANETQARALKKTQGAMVDQKTE